MLQECRNRTIMEVIDFQKEVLKGFVEKKVFFKITHHSAETPPPS